jgi:uncharacterized protein YuzE
MTFKLNYDQDVDAAYFQIEDKTVLESEEIADGIIIDYDKNNEIVGVELLGVTTINPKDLDLLISLLPQWLKAQIQEEIPLK